MATEEGDDLHHLSPEQQHEIQQGRAFLHQFFAILRGALYHATNNTALDEPSQEFAKILEWVLSYESGKVAFVAGQGQIFLGSMRIRPHSRQAKVVKDLEKFLTARGLGGLKFNKSLTADQCRELAQLLVAFVKPEGRGDAVSALTKELETARLALLVEAMPPIRSKTLEGTGQLGFKTELGQVVQQFAKGFGVLTVEGGQLSQTPGGRGVMKHVIRDLAEMHGEMMDSMIGLAMLAACVDYPMRSLMAILVAMSIADQFGASKELMSEVGQVGAELAFWDKEVLEQSRKYGKALAGIVALEGLNRMRQWPLGTLRRQISVAGRYLRPSVAPPNGNPAATRVAEIIRIAADYVDLVTPTPMVGSEQLFAKAPLAPHEALLELRDQAGERFSLEVYAGLVRGVGYLPVGTAVLTADGVGCIITKRTTDPFTFFAKDTRTLRDREAALLPGRNQIVRVVVGNELLEVRAKCLLGEDHATLLSAAAATAAMV